jgi:hypothetical protein
MRPQRVVLVCLAALALVGGACGGGDKSSDLATKDPKAAMKAAATRTAEAKTVRLALTATSATKVKVLSGSGSYDFTNERGRFTLKTTLGSGADMLITPTDVYIKVPKKAKPTDPSWIKLTEADITAASEGGSGQFIQSIRKQVDPRTTLTALGTSVPDLTKIGEATIRGTKTTHLRGKVDLSDKAIAAAPASQQEGLRAAQKVFGADGYPVDVWLDSDGRVRRVQYEVTSGEGAAKSTTTVKLDLYDFGKAPTIELPAASDVGDASSLTTTTTAGK